MADGSVYLFNTTRQELRLELNTKDAGKIPPMTQGEGGAWKFGTLVIKRVVDPKPRSPFFGDENELIVKEPRGNSTYNVNIDLPIEDDLQMVLFYKGMVLAKGGLVLQQEFTKLSEEEMQALAAL